MDFEKPLELLSATGSWCWNYQNLTARHSCQDHIGCGKCSFGHEPWQCFQLKRDDLQDNFSWKIIWKNTGKIGKKFYKYEKSNCIFMLFLGIFRQFFNTFDDFFFGIFEYYSSCNVQISWKKYLKNRKNCWKTGNVKINFLNIFGILKTFLKNFFQFFKIYFS